MMARCSYHRGVAGNLREKILHRRTQREDSFFPPVEKGGLREISSHHALIQQGIS